jgi:hypothetical protein
MTAKSRQKYPEFLSKSCRGASSKAAEQLAAAHAAEKTLALVEELAATLNLGFRTAPAASEATDLP